MSGAARSNLVGAATALAAFALFAAHDAVVKSLGGSYAPMQILFFSVTLGFPLAVVLLVRDPTDGTLRPRLPGWTAARTAAAVVTGLCAFYAFSTLPLSQVYALLFATPLLITVLSIPVLGEVVRLRRWGAVVAGLVGVLIVLRPGSVPLTAGHAAAITAACGAALAAVIVRRIGGVERAMVLMLYPMLANFAVMGAALPFVYRPMPGRDFAALALLAVLAFVASLLMIAAYRRAEAQVVAPMQYSQILWAILYGALFFDEYPDAMTLLGAGIVIASGLYILARERGLSASARPVARTRSRPETGTFPRIGALLGDRRDRGDRDR
jgi:drug/metabolite transporter (DMT)-like permease